MRCLNCGGFRHNPGDEDLRRLERDASTGDIYAARQLSVEKHRRGICESQECWLCLVTKMQSDSNLDADKVEVREAAEALGEIGNPAAIPALIEAMQNDSSSLVRGSAAWALGEIGDPAVIPILSEIIQNDPDWGVRLEIALALGKLMGES